MRIADAVVPAKNEQSVVRGEYLSHGTLECYDLQALAFLQSMALF